MNSSFKTAPLSLSWRDEASLRARAPALFQRAAGIIADLASHLKVQTLKVRGDGFVPLGPAGGQGVRILYTRGEEVNIHIQFGSRGPGFFLGLSSDRAAPDFSRQLKEAIERIPTHRFQNDLPAAPIVPPPREVDMSAHPHSAAQAEGKYPVHTARKPRADSTRENRHNLDRSIRKASKGRFAWKEGMDIVVTKGALMLAFLLERYGWETFSRQHAVESSNKEFPLLKDFIGHTLTNLQFAGYIVCVTPPGLRTRGLNYRLSKNALVHLEKFLTVLPKAKK